MPSMSELQSILDSSDWKDLTQRLLEFVENLNLKVVPARSGFQM
jgi:hypothetical protein